MHEGMLARTENVKLQRKYAAGIAVEDQFIVKQRLLAQIGARMSGEDPL